MVVTFTFNKKTQIGRILEILSDLEWHCAECELPGSQPAKAIQILRQHGFEFEKAGSNWEKRIYCHKCKRTTSHRRLISKEPVNRSWVRKGIPPKLAARIRELLEGKDAILGYEPTGRIVEIDHRVPQVRWNTDEESLDVDMPDEEIKGKFMLLTRENNLLKSRHCEGCVETGRRPAFLGIEYRYSGDDRYDPTIGCVGCGWHSPEAWKSSLNETIIRTLPRKAR